MCWICCVYLRFCQIKDFFFFNFVVVFACENETLAFVLLQLRNLVNFELFWVVLLFELNKKNSTCQDGFDHFCSWDLYFCLRKLLSFFWTLFFSQLQLFLLLHKKSKALLLSISPIIRLNKNCSLNLSV